MKTGKLLVTAVFGSSLIGGLGCDSGSGAELEAARAELSSARAELVRSAEQLEQATAELRAAREALAQASATVAMRALDSGAAEGLSDAGHASTRCVGEVCKVDRAFIRKALENPGEILRQARLIPSVKDGASAGFKLYGIRSRSIPKLAGLKNGDLLIAVNGSSLLTLDEAMAAYTAHKGDDRFVISIVRKGKPISLTVELVDGGEVPGEGAPSSPE